jgi:hypothetical protein
MKLQITAAVAMLVGGSLAQAAGTGSLTTAGYAENFDSLGTSGTALPNGWAKYIDANGDKASWKDAIPASGTVSVANMALQTTALTATTTPSGTNTNGFNAALNAGTTGDRVLASSPTGIAGVAFQLSLVNDTGSSLNGLTLSYDIVRFTSTSSSDSDNLVGYQLFYSLNGTSWANVAALNPTVATVPNSVGVSRVIDASFSFSSAVSAGSSFYLRWVDDNGSPSPDQIIGLNNVSVSAVPEPGTCALLLAGLAATGFVARRRSAR